MEQQQTQANASPEINVSPKPRLPRGSERCHARNRDRSQCRNHVQDPAAGLCARHAACTHDAAGMIDDSTNIALDLLDSQMRALDSTHAINIVLTNVVIMLAKGRISPRRASVITFALSLLLRSVIVQDREAANAPPEITWGSSRPDPVQDEPAPSAHDNADANPQAHPQTSHVAMENYARLRT
jgi:hypothetical protein